jgi:hypothetical protein
MIQKIQIQFILAAAVVKTHMDMIQRLKVKVQMMITLVSGDITKVCYLF